MKILQINKFFYMRGGAERHYFDVCDLLKSKGHEVIYFSMKDKKNRKSPYEKYFVSNVRFDPPNLKSILKAGRIIYSPEARRKLSQLVADTKPDIAHVHLMYHQLSPSILLALRDAGIPTVMTIHDWQALCPNYRLFVRGKIETECRGGSYWHVFRDRAIKNSYLMSGLAAMAGWLQHRLRWYEELVQKYIAPTKFVQKLFLSYGWNKDQIVHIPHFAAKIPPYKKATKEPYLLYAGRLVEEKGIDRLVQYWGENNLQHKLKIAGRGPLQKKIAKLITEYSLSDRVELLGFIEPDKLNNYMQKAAAVIAPPVYYETFGLTVIEAWAMGTGVIASDLGPLPEFVKGSRAGEIFSWKNKQELKKTIDKYMKDKKKWEEYGREGREIVKKKYNKERYYEKIMELYESLL